MNNLMYQNVKHIGTFLKSIVKELKEKRQQVSYFELESSLLVHMRSAVLIPLVYEFTDINGFQLPTLY